MRTDQLLKQYLDQVKPGGKIIDIGFGTGRQVINLVKKGFAITALDKDKKTVNELREKISKFGKKMDIKIENGDIKDYDMSKNFYNAVLAFNSLIFLKKSEFLKVVQKIKDSLSKSGLIFISLFTTDDPSYKSFQENAEPVEKNTFLSKRSGLYWHFMDKSELKSLFSDFETLFYEEMIIHDKLPTPHNHGMVFYVGKKIAP